MVMDTGQNMAMDIGDSRAMDIGYGHGDRIQPWI